MEIIESEPNLRSIKFTRDVQIHFAVIDDSKLLFQQAFDSFEY